MAESRHPTSLLSLYYEGELPLADRQVVTEHLADCPLCRYELSLLRQTVEILDEAPLERAPHDFLDKFTRRLEQDERFRLLEAQRQQTAKEQARVSPDMQDVGVPAISRPTSPVFPRLTQGLYQFWQTLCFPLRLKLPLYTAVGVAVVAAFLFRSFPEGRSANRDKTLTKTQTSTESPRQDLASIDIPAPQPPQTPTSSAQHVSNVPPPPVPKPSPAQLPGKQEILLPSPPIAALEGAPPVAEPIVWRVEGEQPEVMQAQAKVLAQRISGVLIVQEEDGLLLLSLPTEQLPAFGQAVRELGQVQTMGGETDPAKPTTTIQIRFLFALDSASLSS